LRSIKRLGRFLLIFVAALIVQDRAFDSNGQFAYHTHDNSGDLPAPAGMLGDAILVNGTLAPWWLTTPRRT
jgi:hypothetical protein